MEPGAGGQWPDMRAGGRITQTPKSQRFFRGSFVLGCFLNLGLCNVICCNLILPQLLIAKNRIDDLLDTVHLIEGNNGKTRLNNNETMMEIKKQASTISI